MLCQQGNQVIPGVFLLDSHKFGQIAHHLTNCRAHLLRGVAALQHRTCAVLKEVVPVVGNAEELTDHQRGQGQEQGINDVHRPVGLLHVVDQAVGDAFHCGPHRRHPPGRELSRQNAAQVVMLRWIHSHEKPRHCGIPIVSAG